MAIGKAWVSSKALGLGLLLVWLGGCGAGTEETKGSEPPALPEPVPSPDDVAEPPPDGLLRPPGGMHGDSAAPAVAMDARGRPVVAWSEFNGYRRFLAVQAWDGSYWQALGEGPGVRVVDSSPSWPSVAVDARGRPVVAWTDTSAEANDRDVYVSRWDGQRWVAIGKPLHVYSGYLSVARAPSLVLDAEGNPVVAWLENNGRTDDVLVWRWNGVTWLPVGDMLRAGPTEAESQAGPVSLVLDPRGRPLVAWQAGANPSRVFVRAFDGSAWRPLGAPLSAREDTFAGDPSLALAPDGTPYVAWTETDGRTPGQVYVRTWDGTAWKPLSAQAGGAGIDRAYSPRLTVDAKGVPRLAWVEWGSSANGLLHLGRWDGSEWAPEPLPPHEGQAPALAVSPRGRPFLAALEGNGPNGTYGVLVLSPNASP